MASVCASFFIVSIISFFASSDEILATDSNFFIYSFWLFSSPIFLSTMASCCFLSSFLLSSTSSILLSKFTLLSFKLCSFLLSSASFPLSSCFVSRTLSLCSLLSFIKCSLASNSFCLFREAASFSASSTNFLTFFSFTPLFKVVATKPPIAIPAIADKIITIMLIF
ncbi:MAG: Uncharacterised protein [Bacteroidetes bacterium MED-G17]|nr:MAG: Uncharacterised protein [Bacteroidetes bacterium MED-G17]